MAMHCENCLRAEHNSCRIMLPAEWEDDLGRCICKCANRDASRLCNVERIAEAKAEKAPKPKRQSHAGVSLGATKWTDAKIMELCRLEREEGMTSRQIGAQVGADATTVRTYLSLARKKGWR